jgi:hypothetical protein
MYVMGASEGLNNVFLKQPNRLDQNQTSFDGSCYSTPCYGYASKFKMFSMSYLTVFLWIYSYPNTTSPRRKSFFGRANADYSNLDRQTYMVPYQIGSALGLNSTYLRNYPVCQCYNVNESVVDTSRGPNSYVSFGAAEFTDNNVTYVITWGGSSFRGPETPTNAWHFNAGYRRQNAHITIMDYQMADIMMATLIQAATQPKDYAFRDGLLAIGGNLLASELGSTGNDLKGIPYQWGTVNTPNSLPVQRSSVFLIVVRNF